MAIVQASGLEKRFTDQPLLSEVSFRLERRARMTLAGPNGSGKTTLLRILAGELSPDAGTLSFEKGARIVLHDQRPPRQLGVSLAEYVASGLDWVIEIEGRMGELEQRMSAQADDVTLAAYSKAQTAYEHAGGYHWREGTHAVARALGFSDHDLERELATFSGGELTRASLARALAAQPDLMLLDEPTNHLDLDSLEWLEERLVELDATVILVAHDRWFLEAVGNSVLELGRSDNGRAKFFAGPWHEWRAEQVRRELALERDAVRREADIARLERFVERFRAKATKARQAKAKQKQIERLRREAPRRDRDASRSLEFSFEPAARTNRIVLELTGAAIEAGSRTLLSDAELWLEAGEHVCLIGPNGAGKSTLLSVLVGEAEPAAGKLRLGSKVELGHLRQHAEIAPGPGLTALAHAQRATGLSERRARALLGRFLFSGDEALKPVERLSGGEAQRLALAILVSSGANLLVLDEPTNHLDVESREALEDALSRFDGTLLLVTHDRALLEAVGTRTVAIEDGSLREYPGGWTQYREAREKARRQRGEAEADPKATKPAHPASDGQPARGKEARRARARARAAVAESKRLEREIEEAEAALRELEQELADPAAWNDPRTAARSSQRHADAKRLVEQLIGRWEETMAAEEAHERR
ncbi:MAG TPA: ABC-F family ATP-binding cassette domain-containing protein [Solirubrobacterales bacterium]|nr:ABC-F family ATP-binding cassette domain-containing protein [Solirubrobacterales bacterium]